jgi:hypothetical protein
MNMIAIAMRCFFTTRHAGEARKTKVREYVMVEAHL